MPLFYRAVLIQYGESSDLLSSSISIYIDGFQIIQFSKSQMQEGRKMFVNIALGS